MSAGVVGEQFAARQRIIERLLLVLVAGVVGLALLKATAPSVAFPGWDLDPSMLSGPVVGLGPTANLGIDLLLITLSGCIVALAGAGGAVVRWWQWALLLAGLASVAWHARFAPHAAQDHLTLGAAWAGAMCAGLAISAAARFENVARLTAGVLFGSVAFFALKAGVQVFVENPQTIEMFKANREAMLAAQGWTPDSFAAKAFERRLYDAPGTGWLGLSNVLSTAGACVTVAGIVLIARGEARRIGVVAGVVGGLVVLYLAGSKGGWGAAAIGVAAIAMWPLVGRRKWGTAGLLLAMPLAALVAIAMRGIVGERIGELSLLFRAQYLNAASAIFAQSPLEGVGPAGFKDAYLLAKSPLNPEEISSPHSVFFDFASTLGLGGVAWSVLLGAMLVSAGGRTSPPGSAPRGVDQLVPRLVLLTLAFTTIGGAWVELEISSPSNVLVRVGGLAAAALIALTLIAVTRAEVIRMAAAVAAAVGLTHAMIEMSAVLSGSAALFACLLGLASATRPVPELPVARGSFARAVPGLLLAVLGLVAASQVSVVSRWEAMLRSASESMGRSAALSRGFSDAIDTDTKLQAMQRLSEAVGEWVTPNDAAVSAALQRVRIQGAAAALQELIAAIAVAPSHSETREAASRVALQLAALRPPNSDERRDLRQTAIQIASDATNLPLRRAASQAWLANVLRGAADLGGDPTLRRDALVAIEKAAALDPWNPLHAANAAKLAEELRDAPAARRWAAKAIELDANMRLDPLRRFEPGERARLEAIAKPE